MEQNVISINKADMAETPIVNSDGTIERKLHVQGIYDDLGEVVLEPRTYTLKERAGCPFRTQYDTKGYSDNEISVTPSDVDVSGYVDMKVMIDRIMRSMPLDIFAERTGAYSGYEEDVDENDRSVEHFEDDVDMETSDVLDVATYARDTMRDIGTAIEKSKSAPKVDEKASEKATLGANEQATE